MTNRYLPEGCLIGTPENRELISSLSGLERARDTGKILEATVLICDSAMRLHVDLYGIEGIIEKKEALFCRNGEVLKDIAIITRVGKPVAFKVMSISYEHGKPVAMLSRREAQMECMRNYLSDLITGDIIPAKVTHLESFGAFVDVGCGIASLLSVDSISVSRISHPRDRLKIGDNIFTVVKTIDYENDRLFVSMKELLGTWNENAACFEVGQTVSGIIRSIESYGVFVELAPNLAGLAELRDGTHDKEIAEVGSQVAVYIKSIIPDRMKIKLVLIDSYKGDMPVSGIKYFIDGEKTSHIDSWRYSPEGSAKLVESIFSPAF
jgi:small subunit ribosomal protein S1